MSLWAVDTSVVVASLLRRHPVHAACQQVFRDAEAAAGSLLFCAHGLAETFSLLCRLPLEPRMSVQDAQTLMEREVLVRCSVRSVRWEDQVQAMRRCVSLGKGGGLVHDALHVACAQAAGAQGIYTLNPRDFRLLWDPAAVRQPGPG